MKIKIGTITLELEPDYSAQEISKAQAEVERWKGTYDGIEKAYYELARLVMNASHHKSLGDTYSGIENLTGDCFTRAVYGLAEERDTLLRQNRELCAAGHPNRGASYTMVLEEIKARARKRRR